MPKIELKWKHRWVRWRKKKHIGVYSQHKYSLFTFEVRESGWFFFKHKHPLDGDWYFMVAIGVFRFEFGTTAGFDTAEDVCGQLNITGMLTQLQT